MAKKKKKDSLTKIFIMRAKKGYAYRPGDIYEVPAEQAEDLIESGHAREPKATLPKDMPGRDELIAAGYETVKAIMNIDDLTKVPGIGSATEQEIAKYLKENS